MINPALNEFPRQTVTAASRQVGEFVFDVVVHEQHSSSLLITENPIESGALVADHAVLQPRTLTISGWIVEHIPPLTSPLFGLQVGARDTFDFLDNIGFQRGLIENSESLNSLPYQSREAFAKVNQVLESFNGLVQSANRTLAPWMLGAAPFGEQATMSGNDRIAALHERLLAIQQSGEWLEVQTGTQRYPTMLIEEVSLFQQKDSSANITLTLKEVIVVATQQISGVSSGNQGAISGQASGRAATQSAGVSDKGRTQPQNTQDESLLNKIKGGLF